MLRATVLLVTILSSLGACGTVAQDRAAFEAIHAELLAPERYVDTGTQAYALVVLRRGPAYSEADTAEKRDLLAAHAAHIEALMESGKLVLAGPCGPQSGADPYEGFFLFDCGLDEARELIAADPVVQHGALRFELVPWWAPAGISVQAR